MSDNSYEAAVVAAHSTPSLRRNQLTRAAKKLAMEFDAQYSTLSRAERDEFLDRMFEDEVVKSVNVKPPDGCEAVAGDG